MFLIRFYPILLLFCINASCLYSSPSSVFWTNCTTRVYPTGIGHIDENVYFTVFNRHDRISTLPPDTGYELGFLSIGDWELETGFDYNGGAQYPWLFNIGIAIEENKLFRNAPSFKMSMIEIGTQCSGENRTNNNIALFIVGKKLPSWMGTNFYLAGFSGGSAMGKNRQGFMAAYQWFFCPAVHCNGKEYHKWMFCADYASGKNTVGGGGFALCYFFTPDINIFNGPTWFNSSKIYGKWKWSVQITINFDAFNPKRTKF